MKILPEITENNYNIYISKISKYPLLKEEDVQVKLLMAYINDENSIKDLLFSNMRFIISLAKSYENKGLELSKLVNAGNKGLLEAIKYYHHGHDDNKFMRVMVKFASKRINNELRGLWHSE